jgi:hypothetical protein
VSAVARIDERREHIMRLDRALRGLDDTTSAADYETRHHFAPGAYAREIGLPAGALVVGKIHRHAHINVVSWGRALVATPEGVLEIEAPYTFVSQPGTKRVVLALTDVVWTTVHVTDETDLDRIEAEVIAPGFDALPASPQQELLP